MTNQDAYLLRENTGTSGVVETASAAVAILADHDIPHLIVGGIAVQEHGYPRVTIDVDIVVPDVLEAVEWLTASLTGPFYRVRVNPDEQMVSVGREKRALPASMQVQAYALLDRRPLYQWIVAPLLPGIPAEIISKKLPTAPISRSVILGLYPADRVRDRIER